LVRFAVHPPGPEDVRQSVLAATAVSRAPPGRIFHFALRHR